MIVISDSSPLISLSGANKLFLLRDLFQTIVIPEAVYSEVVGKNKNQMRQASDDIATANWILRQAVVDREYVRNLRNTSRLGIGEAEVIVLAEEASADWVIIDDRRARNAAMSKRLNVIGTLGILVLGKRLGLVESVRNVLDAVMQSGFRVSKATYRAALLRAGEIED